MNFKQFFHQKFNQDENYQAIIKRINKKQALFSKPTKIALATAFVLLIAVIPLYNGNTPVNQASPQSRIMNSIHINEIAESIKPYTISDWDYNLLEGTKLENENLESKYYFLSQLKIPLKNTNKFSISYYNNDNDLVEYSLLLTDDGNRAIRLVFNTKDDHTIMPRNCINISYEYEKAQTSMIANLPVKILYNPLANRYDVNFRYKDITFDLETTNLSEIELIELITSIITN